MQNRTLVDASIVDLMRAAADNVQDKVLPVDDALEFDLAARVLEERSWWMPETRNPEHVFLQYAGETDQIVSESQDQYTTAVGWQFMEIISNCQRDLAYLRPPKYLDKAEFDAYVAAVLLQVPMIRDIDNFLVAPQRFGAVRAEIRRRAGLSNDEATVAWQTLMGWLLHFLPNRYRYSRPRHSEILERVLPEDG